MTGDGNNQNEQRSFHIPPEKLQALAEWLEAVERLYATEPPTNGEEDTTNE